MQQQSMSKRGTQKTFSLTLNFVLATFDSWQVKLGLAELSRKTEYGVTPLPLFEFGDNEKFQVITKPA